VSESDLNTRLAVLLRGVQWAADDVAFRLPTGGVTPGELVALADQMNVVANILRTHAAGSPPDDGR